MAAIRIVQLFLLKNRNISLRKPLQRYKVCYYCQQINKPASGKIQRSQYFKPLGWIRQFIFSKFLKYVQGYELILEKNFPRAFKVYQIFSIGIKEFYQDIKLFASVVVQLRQGKIFQQLTRREIEKYHAMPGEILRVAPVLLISALPFANYVIFPIAYVFPKNLLSVHFWSIQQKVEFSLQDHKQKLHNYRPVFRHLQSKVSTISDATLQNKCAQIFFKLGSGTHPTVFEILEVKEVFCKEPYSLRHLPFSHISSLCRMHRLSVIGLRKRRLWYHAGIIRQMDLAILREDMRKLNSDELRYICFLRGINPVGMSTADMLTWLKNWISITKQLDGDSLSLLLHCPVLLAYNSPTNWNLIH